ncbi:MAG: UvrD-helicase domain-containing protein [Verrucomicrobia bacterium]|nr:UvrD-helicase domain-containing protein [Verrucomicrobiota bacterium]
MDLNAEQQKAVEHLEGPLLVLAGAGSGKTRIVTARIAHLLELGVPASEILAVTFTNKAAGEMQERVRRLTNTHVLICTFHSLGAKILRQSISALGYSPNFAIYDQEDSDRLVRDCLKELGSQEKAKAFRTKISEAKNQLIPPQELKIGFSPIDKLLPDLYSLYQTKLKEFNALDFDDLLYLTVKLFDTDPFLLEHYQQQWRFLLIDEYQDTNHAQYLMARKLVEKSHNLFVVGDPDQSIYSWRGANVGNILHFEEDYPGAKVVRLEQNYRSTNLILRCANHLIRHNTDRYEKELWSTLGEGQPIEIVRCRTEQEEAQYITQVIDRLHVKEGMPLEEMVVFYRTNAQSRSLEDALLARRLPYIIVGGISFYQRREIKDLIGWLRMVDSGADFLSFERTINLPKRGLGEATLEKLRLGAQAAGERLVDFCLHGAQGVKLSKKQQEALASYVAILEKLRTLKDKPLVELVAKTIELSGYLDVLRADPETYEERKENLDELVSKAAEWGSRPLTSFLEELSLKSSLDEASTVQERLCLMTLHNGKGLEFRITFISGMEEGLFPHNNSLGDEGRLEEERRLAYVGMTRAKERLILTSTSLRFIWGSAQTMRQSRFIDELPQRDCVFLSPHTHDPLAEDLDEGEEVYHRDFGPGTLEEIGENSLGLVYKVRFQKDGTLRSLIAKYAKLSRLSS